MIVDGLKSTRRSDFALKLTRRSDFATFPFCSILTEQEHSEQTSTGLNGAEQTKLGTSSHVSDERRTALIARPPRRTHFLPHRSIPADRSRRHTDEASKAKVLVEPKDIQQVNNRTGTRPRAAKARFRRVHWSQIQTSTLVPTFSASPTLVPTFSESTHGREGTTWGLGEGGGSLPCVSVLGPAPLRDEGG